MVGNVSCGEEEKQERSGRHFCKVCNEGFRCGGALGGHMRAHVIGDINNVEEENSRNELSEGNYKHPYSLQAKTSRYVGYQVSEEERHKQKSKATIKMDNNYDDHDRYSVSSEEEDLANCLVLLSNTSCALSNKKEIIKAKQVEIKGMFQCKSCKKIFNSHQALGGHRASHKKVKESHDSYSKKTSKVHECSVCRRVFSSGQALGGHKRCHWLTSTSVDNAFIPRFHKFQNDHSQELCKKPDLAPASIPAQHDRNLSSRENITADNTISKYEDSTRLYQKQWGKGKVFNSITSQNQHKIQGTNPVMIPDGLNSENTTEIKLNDLREMNLDGGSSNWLQVGIASTANIS
ncbi:zinc finger protein ZAT9-like [Olea europaea var. sylvestris]|uniref:zinc finger protein ZAT9-like n=1 Tax=Olea europaea var. sylvestris TaxID=158386 RepID=UPI000C1CF5CC|nr:zinc finger protein ZAT9-like [Olea europaea var. sylvestris]